MTAILTNFVTIIIVLQQLFCAAIPSDSCAFVSSLGRMQIVAEPVVFDCGNSYSVIWATNLNSTGSVRFVSNGKEYVYYDTVAGNIRSNDTVHSVKIPKDVFNGAQYSVSSQYVLFNFAYFAIKGKTVESEKISFRSEPGDDGLSFFVLNDIHDNTKAMQSAVSFIETKPDFVVLAGDTASELLVKNSFIKSILGGAYIASKGEVPVVYTRGNHETRGEFATEMRQYFSYPNAGYYFTFNYGPLSAVVLDTGEDKDDDHAECSGLVDFEQYRKEEYAWLCGLTNSVYDGAQYRLAFGHMPGLTNHFGQNWAAELDRLGTQLMLCGHSHTLDLRENLGSFDTLICGGKQGDSGFIATCVTLSDGNAFIHSCTEKGEVVMNSEIIL